MKYNEWCHRKPIVDNSGRYFNILSKISVNSISEISKSALLQREMFDSDGFEFIVFTNLKFDNPVIFKSGLELRPCFYSNIEGKNVNDPIYQASFQMHNRARFMYDGYLPISNWEFSNISKELEKIEEVLTLFSLTGLISFEWEPKYFYKSDPRAIIYADTHLKPISILDEVESFSTDLEILNKEDRKVIYKSISWLNKAENSNDSIIAFLFYMLAIENLVHYIEESTNSDSAFFKIRTISSEQKNLERKECIREILKDIQSDEEPWKLVQKAYVDCVYGVKKRIERKINREFKKESNLQIMFNEKINKKSIYDLRSKIAHGDIDTLNVDEINEIKQRIPDLKNLAVNYVISVLYKCDILYPEGKMHASFGMDMDNVVLSRSEMFKGSTHMCIYYFNKI